MEYTPQHIETERLILRSYTEADIEPSYRMNLDKEVSKYTHDGGVLSLDEVDRRIREDVMGDYAKHGYGRWAVIWKETNEFIGFAGLKYCSDIKEVDIGYRFFSSFWGKGIATEASIACLNYGFNELKLERIVGHILPDNIGSKNVLVKTGFTFEFEFDEDGEVAHQYALSKEEWNQFNKL